MMQMMMLQIMMLRTMMMKMVLQNDEAADPFFPVIRRKWMGIETAATSRSERIQIQDDNDDLDRRIPGGLQDCQISMKTLHYRGQNQRYN